MRTPLVFNQYSSSSSSTRWGQLPVFRPATGSLFRGRRGLRFALGARLGLLFALAGVPVVEGPEKQMQMVEGLRHGAPKDVHGALPVGFGRRLGSVELEELQVVQNFAEPHLAHGLPQRGGHPAEGGREALGLRQHVGALSHHRVPRLDSFHVLEAALQNCRQRRSLRAYKLRLEADPLHNQLPIQLLMGCVLDVILVFYLWKFSRPRFLLFLQALLQFRLQILHGRI
mmetsp:Transcript_125728/g.298453  ORF Transcript_125728/g.298453 Transcript_125728/m.298453 type:complete len:228 (-) Transcript_125728:1373-2056(-)